MSEKKEEKKSSSLKNQPDTFNEARFRSEAKKIWPANIFHALVEAYVKGARSAWKAREPK